MKETDNAQQRQGWVVRLHIDALGVAGFDTHVVQLNRRGLPHYDRRSASPCWQRGESEVGRCVAGQRSLSNRPERPAMPR